MVSNSDRYVAMLWNPFKLLVCRQKKKRNLTTRTADNDIILLLVDLHHGYNRIPSESRWISDLIFRRFVGMMRA